MRLSLFRSKSSTSSSPKPKGRLSSMWSPTRTKSDSGNDVNSLPNSPAVPPISPLHMPGDDRSSDARSPNLPPFSPNSEPLLEEEDTKAPSSNVHTDGSDVDERDMARRLMDVESSFIPDLPPVEDSPHHTATAAGTRRSSYRPLRTDDSTVNGAESRLEENIRDVSQEPAAPSVMNRPSPLAANPSPYRRAYPSSQRDSHPTATDKSYVPSTIQHDLSSPSVAAAQRSKLRATSSRSPPQESFGSYLPVIEADEENGLADGEDTPKQSRALPSRSAQNSTLSSRATSGANNSSAYLQTDPIEQKTSQLVPGKRPSHLQKHQASQHSSVSSFVSQPASGTTVGAADFALQSGGALADEEGPSVRESRELSRIPSLGSIASSLSSNTERHSSHSRKRTASAAFLPSTGPGNLERLIEAESPRSNAPETPGAVTADLAQPTETVLAQRVRDVEVPATVAREFRASHPREENETKSFLSTPQYGRGKTNLTLKEQNSKIDKLSKENFDLKLKIHYLHQALQDRSDEGVKDLLDKNAQLQADLVKSRKENQSLRKRVRDLERNQANQAQNLTRTRRGFEDSEDDWNSGLVSNSPAEEEMVYLRDRNQFLEEENERLARRDNTAGGFTDDVDPDYRQQAEKEIQVLREEIARLRSGRSPRPHLRLRPSDANVSTATGESSRQGPYESAFEASSGFSSSTFVEQLRQENADLRRDLGAQTSMLTSRNRERERLQQEIEDLKLVHRRDGARSAAGDSILDRSVSRNAYRPTSRGGASSRSNQVSDSDREHFESVLAGLRDDNAALRMRVQDMQRALNEERDRAIYRRGAGSPGTESAVRSLNGGRAEIEYLEGLLVQKDDEMAEVWAELRGKEEESDALQLEIKSIGESLNRLIDDMEANEGVIQNLQDDLTNANGEIEASYKSLREAVEAKERLEVQAESSQSEISFLREEQEGDKIKIGELQTALRHAKTNLRDEKARAQEIEDLEADATKAREEVRALRRAVASKESESTAARDRLDELESALGQVFGGFDSSKGDLVREATKLQRDLENMRNDLESTRLDAGEKERVLKERDNLLESSNHETRRLTDLLEKERQARKQDRSEFEKAQRSGRLANPEARIVELEQARTQDRKKLSVLEQKYKDQLVERHKLLFSLWQRLSALCGPEWAQRHGLLDEQGTTTSVESISQNLPSFGSNVLVVVKTIEKVFSTFHTRILNAEKEIGKDYAKLEKSLENRAERLEILEKAVQHAVPSSGSATGAAEYLKANEQVARLKSENKLLRRELKFLKQGSFALPGLPSPVLDDAASASSSQPQQQKQQQQQQPPPFTHSASASAVPTLRSTSHGSAGSSSSKHHTHSAAHGFGLVPRQQLPSTDLAPFPQQQQTSSAGAAEAPLTHQPKHPSSSSTSAPAPAASSSDQRWILRFEELNRRLAAEQQAKHAEREARLLDRKGARERLQERGKEVQRLKGELEVERGRSRRVKGEEEEVEGEGVD